MTEYSTWGLGPSEPRKLDSALEILRAAALR